MFAVYSSLENLAHFLSEFIYGMGVYPATVESFAGFSLILGSILGSVGLVFFV